MSREYPSYTGAMEAAGAEILAFEQFGSYQGDWWAKVSYRGQIGWVHGSYGSCSVCDAVQAEFDGTTECEKHRWSCPKNCDPCIACDEAAASYDRRYLEFGGAYLGSIMDQDEAEHEASRNLGWDSEAKEVLDFLKREAL